MDKDTPADATMEPVPDRRPSPGGERSFASVELPNINLSVGRSCFTRCDGCYNHFGRSRIPLATATLLRFLVDMRSLGFRRVTFCGGDPLSRRDFLDITAEAHGAGFAVKIDSVGTPILGRAETQFFGQESVPRIDLSELAPYVEMFGVPLDGIDNTQCLEFRKGRPGIYEETLRIVDALEAHSIDVCVNTVVHKLNATTIHRLVDVLRRHRGIRRWQLFQYQASGPLGFASRGKYAISDDVFLAVVDRIIDRSRDCSFGDRIEFKGNWQRKDRYLLVDTDGQIWVPEYDEGSGIPESPNRHIISDLSGRYVEDVCAYLEKLGVPGIDPADPGAEEEEVER